MCTTEDISYRQCAPIYSSFVFHLGRKKIGLDKIKKKKTNKEESTEHKAEGKKGGGEEGLIKI